MIAGLGIPWFGVSFAFDVGEWFGVDVGLLEGYRLEDSWFQVDGGFLR